MKKIYPKEKLEIHSKEKEGDLPDCLSTAIDRLLISQLKNSSNFIKQPKMSLKGDEVDQEDLKIKDLDIFIFRSKAKLHLIVSH